MRWILIACFWLLCKSTAGVKPGFLADDSFYLPSVQVSKHWQDEVLSELVADPAVGPSVRRWLADRQRNRGKSRGAHTESILSEDKRRGVVFVPPFAGTQLEALLKNREIISWHDVPCPTNSNGTWMPAWIPPFASVWDKLYGFCDIENVKIPPPKGVTIRFVDNYQGTMCLDKVCKSPTLKGMSDTLENLGWVQGVNLFSLPYDWRGGPSSYAEPGGEFDRLKALIETAVKGSGGPITVVSMSMGGPIFALFCAKHVSEDWKATHIHSFFSISGVYGGATVPFRSIFTGSWANIIPKIFWSTTKNVARSWECLPWILPSAQVFSEDRVWIQTPTRNLTTRDLGKALEEAGADDIAKNWQLYKDLAGPVLVPNVTTFCVHGAGLPTLEKIGFATDDLKENHAYESNALGDGTVLVESLEMCGKFAQYQKMPVKSIVYQNVSHTDFLKFTPMYKDLVRVLGS